MFPPVNLFRFAFDGEHKLSFAIKFSTPVICLTYSAFLYFWELNYMRIKLETNFLLFFFFYLEQII